jgi:hypothetical protein
MAVRKRRHRGGHEPARDPGLPLDDRDRGDAAAARREGDLMIHPREIPFRCMLMLLVATFPLVAERF